MPSCSTLSSWLAVAPDALGAGRRPCAPATIKHRLTGVLAGWRGRGVPYPRGITAGALSVVDDYARQLVLGAEIMSRTVQFGDCAGYTLAEGV
jgi:hypothetical protein